MKHIFREYDIRGIAERDLTDETAYGVGRGFARELGAPEQPLTLAVGRDCRVSSDRLFAALVRGLTEGGVNVIDIGVGPTPMLYFAVFHLGTGGGVMITGSHNPGDENGFKMMRGKASFFGKDIQALYARVSQKDFGAAASTKGTVSQDDVKPAYIAQQKKSFSFAGTNFPFVLDAGNGAGGPLALATFEALGLKVDPLFCDMDGAFPNHHPDPTVAKNLEALIKRVKETGARVGLAFDGDADRLGAVDEQGNIIWGDKLMVLFSRDVLKNHPGASILGEVKCSQTLYDDIAKHGGKPVVWKTGHSLIKTKMKEEHALLAGEMSGHIFFADRYFGFDDGLYAALRLLEILSADPRPISEMLADVPVTFSTPELRVDCPDAIKFDVVRAVTAHFKELGLPVLDIDGARIQFGKPGEPIWGLVRASNTGPILVMRFEATTQAELTRIQTLVEDLVARERNKLVG
jgi:phosphomannomutase / phosphoglucomutase